MNSDERIPGVANDTAGGDETGRSRALEDSEAGAAAKEAAGGDASAGEAPEREAASSESTGEADSSEAHGEEAGEGDTTPPETTGDDAAVAHGASRAAHGARGERDRKTSRKGSGPASGAKEAEIERLGRELESLRSEVHALKDRWLRTAAEFDNYRKRTRKEWELLQLRTKADTVLGFLSVVDDFERAFSAAGDRDDDFIRGMRLIYNKLTVAAEEVGVRKIEALHTAFDPVYHMSVAQIEREGSESGQVVEVVQEGYSLGDIVIRPAKVVIAK
jgi:molecular chaperone GrpE